MQDIFVYRSQIWSQRQNNHWSCDRKTRHVNHRAISAMLGTCSEKTLLYNRTCLGEERDNTFKVIQYGSSSTPNFLCIKFIKRSENVVQIMEGPTMNINHPDLCDERKLELDKWPWIAPFRKQAVTCPISGGFSFRTINKLTNQDFCEEEWRKSRLEIDCAKGDGLNFIAPRSSKCNPFSTTSEVSQFYCWAGWQESTYTFLVVGDDKTDVPQYTLRFPRDMTRQFSVMVYFSVLCPLQEDGRPETGIEYHEMVMDTLDDTKCTNDDEAKCEIGMKRGQCKKREKFAMHCQKSCKQCDKKSDALNLLCPFPRDIQHTWLFVDTRHKEEVKINESSIHFSQFGTFTCIERSFYSDTLYKTVTVFNNGCAMRYTCFEFRRRDKNVLQFRAGESHRTDEDFEGLCKFQDHESAVKQKYRSGAMKNLILDGFLWDRFCGINSSIAFNGSIYGEQCHGTVSDWQSDGCVTRGVMSISSSTCTNLADPLEYQCLVFLADDHPLHPLEQYIITKNVISGDFNCWVLTSYRCEHWQWPHGKVLYKLDTPQCTAFSERTCAVERTPEAILFLHDDEKTRYCKGDARSRVTSLQTTTSSQIHVRHSSEPASVNDHPYSVNKGDRHTGTVFHMNSGGAGGLEDMNAVNSISIATSIACIQWIKSFIFSVTFVTLSVLIFIFPT